MTNESWLSGADGCTNLQRLLEGNLALREGDIDSCASHWKLCPICREAYPDAMARIRGLRRALDMRIAAIGDLDLLELMKGLLNERVWRVDNPPGPIGTSNPHQTRRS
jgi:hypothetical protein